MGNVPKVINGHIKFAEMTKKKKATTQQTTERRFLESGSLPRPIPVVLKKDDPAEVVRHKGVEIPNRNGKREGGRGVKGAPSNRMLFGISKRRTLLPIKVLGWTRPCRPRKKSAVRQE